MSVLFLMTVQGTKQGKFKGSVTTKGKFSYTDGIEVHSFSFGTTTPVDNSKGGGAGGRRPFAPGQITKQTGSAAAPLFQNLASAEIAKQVGLRPFPSGLPGTGGSGSNGGKHTPVVIRKSIDAASPLFLNACCSNELLTTVQVSFNRGNPSGKEQLWQTITLTNATISNVRRFTDPDFHQPSEEIHFAYQNLRFTYDPPK